MPIKVGEKAPLFTLRNSATEEVSLSDYKEKNLVVLFFPLAFTGVCTTELCEIRDSIAEYNNMNAEGVFAQSDINRDELYNMRGLKILWHVPDASVVII